MDPIGDKKEVNESGSTEWLHGFRLDREGQAHRSRDKRATGEKLEDLSMVYAFGRLPTVLLAIVLASSFLRSAVQIPSPRGQSEVSVRAAVEAAYKAYLRAWKNKDYPALNRLLSDDYQAVNFQGIVSTKANEIATAKEDRNYDAMTGDVMSVTVFGDCAIASGLIEATWKDSQGRMQRMTFRFLAILKKQKGEWKLVATQSTRFNKPVTG